MARLNRKYQGFCLLSSEGWKKIGDYDRMPPKIRKRLRNSPFNICPACVLLYARLYNQDYIQIIENFENLIRKMEV